MLIAIPIYRLTCKVGIDRGRAWSVADELLLWAVDQQPRTIAALVAESALPRQVVVASLARMMRFRLVEVALHGTTAKFKSSSMGREIIQSGQPMPHFPKRQSRRVSFVIEKATGRFFLKKEIPFLLAPGGPEQERINGEDVRIVEVIGEGPLMSPDANFRRLSAVAARGWEEQLASIDGRTASMRDDEYMGIRVVDGVARGLPEEAGQELRDLVQRCVAKPLGTRHIEVAYSDSTRFFSDGQPTVSCEFNDSDLIVGGPAHRKLFLELLENARTRVIMHSTFIREGSFRDLADAIRAACRRGVAIEILWGADDAAEDIEKNNIRAATKVMEFVRNDADMARHVRVQMRTTGSHAKILFADNGGPDWIAVIGSCNWLSSPFSAVELSVVLRDPGIVAQAAKMFQNLVGRRGIFDELGTDLAIVSRQMSLRPLTRGSARVTIVTGERHDSLMRLASGTATRRLVVGTNKLGSTARPGALIQGEFAAKRHGVEAVMLFATPSGPLRHRDARALVAEESTNGVKLVKTEKPVLHGKFLFWDDDNVVITSLNWGSASTDSGFPEQEVGVHIFAPGIAASALDTIASIFPKLVGNFSSSK